MEGGSSTARQAIASAAPRIDGGRRRGRPSRSEERAITASIVAAALNLFLSGGYSDTSMQRIGTVAGVSAATLYARFPDKAAVYKAAVQRQIEIWHAEVPSTLPSRGASLAEVVRQALAGTVEALHRPDVAAFSRLVLAETERFPEVAQIYADYATANALRLLKEALLASPEAAGIDDRRIAAISKVVLATAMGLSRPQLSPPGAAGDEEIVAEATEVLVAGVLDYARRSHGI